MSKLNVRIIVSGLLASALASAQPIAQSTHCPAQQLDHNRQVAGAIFEEVLSKGRIEENEHLYHAEFVAHGVSRDAGRAEDRAASQGWRQAVPDLRMDVLRMVVECDQVAVHWSGSGTNTGSGNGLPATGRRLELLWGMTIFGLRNGQIREEWTVFDQYSMLQQLGLLPTPAAESASAASKK